MLQVSSRVSSVSGNSSSSSKIKCSRQRSPQQQAAARQQHQQQCHHHHHHQHKHVVAHQPLLAAAAAAAVTAASLLCSSPAAYAATADANFGTKCVGCHVNGGNIIQAGATLFQEDLVKNGVADSDGLYKLIYSGKARMPGFGADCAPKLQCTFGPRLTDEEVQDLVQYVQDQAAAGWKQ